jgi:poly(3-hydroxyoctanoate) depolymerase
LASGGEHLRIAGTELFVREAGDGPPVLLINGMGAHHGMWEPLTNGLPTFRTIAFDAPGIGLSPPRAEPVSIQALARLCRALIDRLGHPRVDVIGYSFGGTVAQQLAWTTPERVRRLVLVNTSCGWGGVPGTPWALACMATPLRYYSSAYYQATARLLAGGRAERDSEFVRRTSELRLRHPPSLSGYASQWAALAGWSSLPWLHHVTTPTLVIASEEDPVIPPANSLILTERIPGARLRVLSGEGHFLLLDERSAALETIADFLHGPDHTTTPAWRAASRPRPADVAWEVVRAWLSPGRWAWPIVSADAAPWGAHAEAPRSTIPT